MGLSGDVGRVVSKVKNPRRDDGDTPIATDLNLLSDWAWNRAWGFAYGKSRVLPSSSHAKKNGSATSRIEADIGKRRNFQN